MVSTLVASGDRGRSPWRVAALLVVFFLLVGGLGLLVAAFTTEPPRPPQPAADAAPRQLQDLPESWGAEPGAGVSALDRSVPDRIAIPAIEVDATLMSLGVDQNGEVEVPPLEEARKAGWYERGVTPGEIGNAVIIGHVDSYKIGPAVFFNLGKLKPGDTVEVTRKDDTVATFVVDGVKSFARDKFPADLVYGPTNQAGLRIVTCGGEFDRKQRSYLDNVIVFATLASTPPGETTG